MQPLGYLAIFAGALLLVAALKGSSIGSVAKGQPDHKYGEPLASAAGGGTSNTSGEPAGSAAIATAAGLGSRRATVKAAAKAHGIPEGILWGVFGAESSWGRGGSNWFGLVAVPRTGSFAGDANAAAATLARLWQQSGHNWDLALKSYSGGSYGYEHVAALAKGG